MLLAETQSIPVWARPGRRVQALDPVGKQRVWHDATVEEVRRGVEPDERGLRIWLRFAQARYESANGKHDEAVTHGVACAQHDVACARHRFLQGAA